MNERSVYFKDFRFLQGPRKDGIIMKAMNWFLFISSNADKTSTQCITFNITDKRFASEVTLYKGHFSKEMQMLHSLTMFQSTLCK